MLCFFNHHSCVLIDLWGLCEYVGFGEGIYAPAVQTHTTQGRPRTRTPRARRRGRRKRSRPQRRRTSRGPEWAWRKMNWIVLATTCLPACLALSVCPVLPPANPSPSPPLQYAAAPASRPPPAPGSPPGTPAPGDLGTCTSPGGRARGTGPCRGRDSLRCVVLCVVRLGGVVDDYVGLLECGGVVSRLGGWGKGANTRGGNPISSMTIPGHPFIRSFVHAAAYPPLASSCLTSSAAT